MSIKPTKPKLQNRPADITNLYREDRPVPVALYHYTQQLFNTPAYTKKFTKQRTIAHKIHQELKKYIELFRKPKQKFTATPNYFLLHRKKLHIDDIAAFYHSLDQLLRNSNANVVYEFTSKQFAAIMPTLDVYVRNANDQLMIYLHGNQILTGAPVIIGGHPHLDYFQWGNLYGVVKYVEIEGEEVNEANLLIYFENRHERKLEQCIHDLLHRLQQENKPKHVPEPIPKPTKIESNAPRFTFGMTQPSSKNSEE